MRSKKISRRIKPATITPDEHHALSFNTRKEIAKRAAKKKDILTWGRYLFPDKFYLPYCHELHEYFIKIRHEPITSTEAPRNHAKTLIKCFLIPIFQALEEPGEFRSYCNVQATEDKAHEVNRAIKLEFEENDLLRSIYGDQAGSRWTDAKFVLKNGTIFTSVSAGQSIRGMNYRNIRPDYIIIDDLYNEDDIHNPISTEKKNEWFWGSLYPARAKSRRNCVHVQGTAINTYDILNNLKKDDSVKSATFRAIKDEVAKTVLWPELNTYDSLMIDKGRMGSSIFYREMQNERRDEETAIVKNSWLDGWEYDPAQEKYDDKYQIALVQMGCDPSIGATTDSDATGVALVIKTKYSDGRGNHFLIEGLWNEHLSLDKRVKCLQDIYDQRTSRSPNHPVQRVNIEAISGFKDFGAEVVRRTNLPVRMIERVKDKISNLENKSHFFENGKVKINKNIDGKLKDLLRYQLTTNHPKHDDLRDAVLLCLEDRQGPSIMEID
jgi:hypothetical protein